MLQAYADGVNAYIADRSPTELGLEYMMMRLTGVSASIEPWSPVDTLAWGKAIAWDLRGNAQDEIDRVRYANAVGGLRASQLYPDFPFDQHPVIVPQGTVVDGEFDFEAESPADDPGCTGTGCPAPGEVDRIETAEEAAARPGHRVGSPVWDESARPGDGRGPRLGRPGADGLARDRGDAGRPDRPRRRGPRDRTPGWWHPASPATGNALLANDPHLGPAIPSLWYQIGLHCRSMSRRLRLRRLRHELPRHPGGALRAQPARRMGRDEPRPRRDRPGPGEDRRDPATSSTGSTVPSPSSRT